MDWKLSQICSTVVPNYFCHYRDEGLSSAFIIAHELGHILGLSHDGDKGAGNQCLDEASHGSVMAPMVGATFRENVNEIINVFFGEKHFFEINFN